MDPADLNSPCQELSKGGLGIVVTPLVRRQIDFFVCISLIGNPAVTVIMLTRFWPNLDVDGLILRVFGPILDEKNKIRRLSPTISFVS